MSMNYIEVYHTKEKGLNAKIHKNGKVCILTNQNTIKRLLTICHKHNIYFNGNRIIKGNVDPIINEFDSYYAKIRKRNKKLIVLADNLDSMVDKIKLVKNNSNLKKIIITTGLATAIGITSLGILNTTKSTKVEVEPELQATIEEVPEYVVEENLAPIIVERDENTDNIEVENLAVSFPTEETIESNNIIENEIPVETTIEETENTETTENIQEEANTTESVETLSEETENTVETENINNELDQMLQSDTFHFSYTDRSNTEPMNNARRYQDLFELYGNRYGVDPLLLMAMAAQENTGKHYEALHSACATGIMQIENDNLNTTVSAMNFETNQIDSVYINEANVEDLETNIQIGAMILSNRLRENNYNVLYSLQKYNMGDGNMARSIAMCSDIENIPREQLINNRTNPAWLNYREFLGVGDSLYVEHVFSYIPSGTELHMRDENGNIITYRIINDNVNNLQLS